jgi:hypothetical protein
MTTPQLIAAAETLNDELLSLQHLSVDWSQPHMASWLEEKRALVAELNANGVPVATGYPWCEGLFDQPQEPPTSED